MVLHPGLALGETATGAAARSRFLGLAAGVRSGAGARDQRSGAGGGYTTEFISATVLTNQTALTAKRYDLLVLPGARSLPMASAPTIESYLREGGDLLALGLPAWQSPLFQVKGQWMSRQSYEEAIAAQRAQHIIEDFDHADLKRWTHSTFEPGAQTEYELAAADHGKALHVTVRHLSGWDTLLSSAL